MTQEIFTYINTHFMESLVLLLVIALFFKDTLVLWINAKFGFFPSDDQRRTLKMAQDMTDLKLHFNDETTAILTDLQVLAGKADQDNTKAALMLEEMRDTLRDMSRNGIRIRT